MGASIQQSFDEVAIPLRNHTFVVVDLETTGTSPAAGAMITEIGAVKIRGGEVLGEFHTLVNPGSPIPPFITVLTGITDAMVAPAPLFNEVLPAFLEFCGSADETILIAHNAPFDIGFLKAASENYSYAWPQFKVLDTVKIARRTLTKDETPNVKLGTLAQYFGLTEPPTHRALDDARATVSIFHHLLERLGNVGVTTFEELQDFSHPLSPQEREKKSLADGLPNVTGLYIFRDKDENPLYIGISKNIKKRVLTYFSASENRSRMREMISLAVRIEALPTPTLIEAQVRELRMINAHSPRYNRRSKFQERSLWLTLTQERFPRLTITKGHSGITRDQALIGPFGGARDAQLAKEALHNATSLRQCTPRITDSSIKRGSSCILYDIKKCPAPCIGAVDEESYSVITSHVTNHLSTEAEGIVTHHLERISELAREERYEEAAELRNHLTAYLRGFSRSEHLKSFSLIEEMIIARISPDQAHTELALIRSGRLYSTYSSSNAKEYEEALLALKSQLHLHVHDDALLPHSTPEEAELLLRWSSGEGSTLVHINGDWLMPTFGATHHKSYVENLAKPDEKFQSNH